MNVGKNLLKVKIENIAKKLLNQNQVKSNDNEPKNDININQLSSDESTIKDSLSEFEEISKTINPHNSRNFKNKKNNFISKNKNISNSNINRHHSSLCTKMTSLSENNSGLGTLDYNSNLEGIKNNFKNKIEKNNKSNELLMKNIIDNNINNINLDLLNNLSNIYNKLLEIFNNNKNYERNIQNNLNDEIKNSNKEIIILSYKYISLTLSSDMELLIKLLYNNIEIQKYFLSQIYLFISIIYLYDENILSNSYLLISYKSITFYSLLNLKNIINILNLPLLLQNEKLINNIKSINKIILSILKILNPKVPSNSQMIGFITPNKFNLNNINYNENKYSGLLKLISLLKENTRLREKLDKIKMKIIDENNPNEKINDIHKENESINNKNNLNTKQINNIETKELNNIKEEENNNKINDNKLMLPPMDINKYKYSIAIELDETLVHYCEEGDNYYAKVRFGSENFLKNIKKYFEIIVVSTSGKEYSNIIIDNINKDDNCYVDHRLYTEDFIEGLNLSNINRDLKKIIFVCHDYNFLNAPKDNIILLKEFNGEEDDREILKLYNEIKFLMNDDNNNNFDIREFVPKIMEKIRLNNDYSEYLEEEGEDEYDNEEREQNIENYKSKEVDYI